MHSSSNPVPDRPDDVHGDAGTIHFSHTVHEEPVDYRELEAPQETGVGGPSLFQAPPIPAVNPPFASTAPGSGSRSSSQGPGNHKNNRRRSSRSRRSRSRRH